MKRKITAKDQYTTYATHPLVSGDVRAYEICLDLGADVAGAEFKVTAIRADGRIIEDIGQVKEGIATYTLASNMYSVPGELTVRLAVLHDMSALTDREIIFKVLDGPFSTDNAETVVPLNDSVILRLGALETSLLGKVDKVSGKTLSSNDFTDEHKQKLDSLDETFGERIGKISQELDSFSDGFSEHKTASNPHNVTAEQVGAYTKEEVNKKLDKKADKTDISNVYRFKGSVNTFEDLPCELVFEATGTPVDNDGNTIGTFDSATGIITIENHKISQGDGAIRIPVETKTIVEGPYACGRIDFGNISGLSERYDIESGVDINHYIGDVDCNLLEYYYPETEISELVIEYGLDVPIVINGSGKVTGYLYKVPRMGDLYMHDPLTVGDVYNVLDTGMNYAWNGTEWDSLSGVHKDAEARKKIGDIDVALGDIIDIQNELIGGDSV